MAQLPARPEISNLVLRAISAAALLPLAVAMVWLGGWMFAIFLGLLGAAMASELAAMSRAASGLRAALIAVAALTPLIFLYAGPQVAAAAVGLGARRLVGVELPSALAEVVADCPCGRCGSADCRVGRVGVRDATATLCD